jgi:hypothetical protein
MGGQRTPRNYLATSGLDLKRHSGLRWWTSLSGGKLALEEFAAELGIFRTTSGESYGVEEWMASALTSVGVASCRLRNVRLK